MVDLKSFMRFSTLRSFADFRRIVRTPNELRHASGPVQTNHPSVTHFSGPKDSLLGPAIFQIEKNILKLVTTLGFEKYFEHGNAYQNMSLYWYLFVCLEGGEVGNFFTIIRKRRKKKGIFNYNIYK